VLGPCCAKGRRGKGAALSRPCTTVPACALLDGKELKGKEEGRGRAGRTKEGPAPTLTQRARAQS